jgi:DNA-directed RNA polymerase subunit RPC12/RpoP
MVNCPNCGFDVVGSALCPNCGTKVEKETSNVLCPNCGFDVGDSAFCPNCGTKVEKETSNVSCPNCGFDVGGSAFCPNCGTKIEKEASKSFCPNCGNDVGDSAFCPSCGIKIGDEKQQNFNSAQNQTKSEENSESALDKMINVDDKISGKFGKLLGKSKSMDLIYEKTANAKRQNNAQIMEYYARNEPVFLEVYNLVEDEFVKSILALEREKLGSVGGGAVGAIMATVHVPTKDMNHDEAMQFYIDIVNNIIDEINMEKQQGTFNEDEFYKRKYKENHLENISTSPILKVFKTMKK